MDLRLASWNVRSLHRPGAIYQVLEEMQRYKMGVAALQEVRWAGQGECAMDNGSILFYSGTSDGHHRSGTGFIVNKNIIGSIIKFEPVSDRICVIRIKSKFKNITIINAYAPTEVTEEQNKDNFYEELETVYHQVPEYDVKILLGDFNAKVGREEIFLPTIGTHSKHELTNENGLRLISFASSRSMVIKSTMFPHKDIHKGTWKSPDNHTINQIDHVLIDSRHKGMIEDVRTFRGADCDSDHFMLGIKIKAKIKVSSKANRCPPEDIIDIEKLKCPEVRKEFQLQLSNRFKELEISDDVEESWKSLQNNIKEVGLQVIGRKQKKRKAKWFNNKCKQMVEETRALKIVAEQDNVWLDKYEESRINTRKTIRAAKREHIKNIVENMESLIRAKETRHFYQEVTACRGDRQSTTLLLEDESGDLVTDDNKIQDMWRQYFKQLLNCPASNHTLQVVAENNEEIEPLTFEEVRNAIMRLKNNKSPGIDNLPAELWKYSGGMAQTKFYEFLVKVWNDETIPSLWNTGIVCPIHK